MPEMTCAEYLNNRIQENYLDWYQFLTESSDEERKQLAEELLDWRWKQINEYLDWIEFRTEEECHSEMMWVIEYLDWMSFDIGWSMDLYEAVEDYLSTRYEKDDDWVLTRIVVKWC